MKKSKTKQYGKEADAFKSVSKGSMDYLSKQSGFASKDASKLRKGKYKESRYD